MPDDNGTTTEATAERPPVEAAVPGPATTPEPRVTRRVQRAGKYILMLLAALMAIVWILGYIGKNKDNLADKLEIPAVDFNIGSAAEGVKEGFLNWLPYKDDIVGGWNFVFNSDRSKLEPVVDQHTYADDRFLMPEELESGNWLWIEVGPDNPVDSHRFGTGVRYDGYNPDEGFCTVFNGNENARSCSETDGAPLKRMENSFSHIGYFQFAAIERGGVLVPCKIGIRLRPETDE